MAEFTPKTVQEMTRRTFLAAGAASMGMALYSSEIARHRVEIVQKTIAITDLPQPFHGLRIAQISDIHFDAFTEPYFVRHVVQCVNELHPDIVLLTGDFVTSHVPYLSPKRCADRCAEILNELTTPERYGILGNHDRSTAPEYISHAIGASGATILRNSFLPLERRGERIWLAGLDDAGVGDPDLNLTLPKDPRAPVLLMVHEPDFADRVVQHAQGHTVSLMLSGHTHGGQVRLPFLPPMALPLMGQKYVEGIFRFGTMQLYVNRGIGTVGVPFRLNCPPEITLITLESA